MPEFEESIVIAEKLLADDRFTLGGEMYRLSEVINMPDDDEYTKLIFYPLAHPIEKLLMVVPKTIEFKIYNQK